MTQTLRELIQRQSLNIDDAQAILRSVLTMLASDHAQGRAHGHLCPENIAVRADMSDGLLGDEPASIRDDAPPHAPAPYRAPELAPGAPPTPAADVYAMGLILFEMLTGTRPAGAELPSEANPQTPPYLDEAFRGAYTRLDRRFASAADMLNCLAGPMALAGVYSCPRCRKLVSAGGDDAGQRVECPHCGERFVLPGGPATGEFFVVDDQTPEEADKHREELDGMRIRQLTQLRRSAIRSNSYMVILAVACVVGAIQLLWNAVGDFLRHRQFDFKPISFVILAGLLVRWAILFARKGAAIRRRLHESEQATPDRPPDFRPLSDGSQYWTNLDRLR